MTKLGKILLITQVVLLLALIALTPYAMSFKPFERIYTDGSYDAPHSEDPLYHKRVFMIGFGLIASFICLACAVVGLILKPRVKPLSMLKFSIALCALTLGWRTYPYWINGIHRVYTQHTDVAIRSCFDPKPLMPMVWLGGIYQLSNLVLFLVIFFGAVGLITGIVHSLTRKEEKGLALWIVPVMLGIIILTLIFSPEYMTWFMD